ncbi:MAG: prolipoprotein diacylglyceryl transferase [Deltaproteobacteria bacterium]|jgi:prolipoprotein diacylglyceryl transferase|nr:prolipoprotein diacylglyceryl transferase [Deltaproteobacteria bacterium]
MAPVWDLDPVLVVIPWGGLAIRYYGLIFSIVFLGGFLLFYWQTLRGGGTVDQAYAVILPGFIGLVLGARLGHVFFYNFEYFSQNPGQIIRIWQGGLTSHGAAVGLALALWYYAHRQKLNFLIVSDRFVFSAALGAGLVRLGNFLNSEIVGKVTDAFWAIRFPLYDQLPPELTPPRYPSQLVESAMGLSILGLLIMFDRLLGGNRRPKGVLSALFLVLYFTGRFLVEFLKERQGPTDDLFLSRGQLLSLPAVAMGLILAWVCLKRPTVTAVNTPSQNPNANESIKGFGRSKSKALGKRRRK